MKEKNDNMIIIKDATLTKEKELLEHDGNPITTTDNYDDYRIALYYIYLPIDNIDKNIEFQKELCSSLNLNGRIRISFEGINGVLSGFLLNIQKYEKQLQIKINEIQNNYLRIKQQKQEEETTKTSPKCNTKSISSTDEDDSNINTVEKHQQEEKVICYQNQLDIKYCHLRRDLSIKSQLFDSLKVMKTKEVISLYEKEVVDGRSMKASSPSTDKRYYRRRRRNRTKNKNKVISDERIEKEETTTCDGDDSNKNKDDKIETNNKDKENEAILYNLDTYTPSKHLKPKEWNELLLSLSKNKSKKKDDSNENETEEINNNDNDEEDEAIIIDARNVYESRIGHFKVDGIPTILTNTRKYSSLPNVLSSHKDKLAGKHVFMYCTGGVRCERVSMYVQALNNSNNNNNNNNNNNDNNENDSKSTSNNKPIKGIYQLEGGIQKYLEQYGTLPEEVEESDTNSNNYQEEGITSVNDNNSNSSSNSKNEIKQQQQQQQQHYGQNEDDHDICLFRGKNFVFDQRRTDPLVGGPGLGVNNKTTDSSSNNVENAVVGQCIICKVPHDDYDNGYSPSDNKESRCCRCRVLVLVCNDCRRNKVKCWGEETAEVANNNDERVDLFCGGLKCINEGNVIDQVEII